DELDRVLDGEDVAAPLAVDLVDHRGEGRALTGARGAGDEDEAARFLCQPLDLRRHPELAERLDVERDLADGQGDAAALAVDVPAEPCKVLDAEREVQLVLGLEP